MGSELAKLAPLPWETRALDHGMGHIGAPYAIADANGKIILEDLPKLDIVEAIVNGMNRSAHLTLIVEIARDLVALWESPRIKALDRAERNAAIDDTRRRLVNAVSEVGMRPYGDDLVEAVTRAIIDCHPRCDHHASYADWIEDEKRVDGANEFTGEHAREWMAARRLEAKAAITVVLAGQPRP